MNYEIIITPYAELSFVESNEVSTSKSSAAEAAWLLEVQQGFAECRAEGLFALVKSRVSYKLSPSLVYWQQVAGRYMLELCRAAENDESIAIVGRDAEIVSALREFYLSAPMMRGGEYFSVEMLNSVWDELDAWLLKERERSGVQTASAWLEAYAPLWYRLGRVCFHLAENKRDEDYPFAFLATYAPKLTSAGRVQYQPLGKALKEYAGDSNKAALVRLLSPVQAAAEKLEYVQDLVETGDLFHPLVWTAQEAHEFLQSIPLLEEAGLLVRVPNWWRKKARPQVSVVIGQDKNSVFGASAMLDFQVAKTLGDEPLTDEEWQELMNADDGLVFIKNQWVEVNKEKLSAMLAHWKAVEAAAEDGVTFAEGMRMLAGAPTKMDASTEMEEHEWAFIHAGDWLTSLLSEMRNPEGVVSPGESDQFLGTLRPYQKVGRDWLYFLSNLGLGACLADDMGLGKTVQVISLLLSLKESGALSDAPSLLVLPASLLVNWESEIIKFAPSLRVLRIHSSAMSKQEIAALRGQGQAAFKDTDIVLTTYGMLLRQEFLLENEWKLAILDEAQAIKNAGSRQTKAVKKLKAKARIALTGTPVENNLGDLWSLFDFLSPGLLGNVSQFRDFTKTGSHAALRKLISPYILRRLKTDKSIISDLPDKTEMKAYCGLSKRQAVLYEKSVDQLKEALEEADGIQRRGIVLSFLMRFKQICNHPSQYLGESDYDMADSGKLQRMKEICDEVAARQEKVLVFTQFREMTEPLAEALSEIFGRKGLVLHGGTPVKRRQEMVNEFQGHDGPPFFVLSVKAGGTGLTLTAASHVIHFDRWWNPAVENQATDRAFRIGQKRNVVVHKFICQGTIEEKIDIMLEGKALLADDLLEGAAQSVLTEMTDDELLSTVALSIDS